MLPEAFRPGRPGCASASSSGEGAELDAGIPAQTLYRCGKTAERVNARSAAWRSSASSINRVTSSR